MNVSLTTREWMHIVTLCAAHDTRWCRVCDDIVMQISLAAASALKDARGEGGDPPSTNSNDAERPPYTSLEELFSHD